MACTIAAVAPVAVRPVAATPLKQARNTFAARTVSNATIKKTTAMQGERGGLRSGRGRQPMRDRCCSTAWAPADPPPPFVTPPCLDPQCGPP